MHMGLCVILSVICESHIVHCAMKSLKITCLLFIPHGFFVRLSVICESHTTVHCIVQWSHSRSLAHCQLHKLSFVCLPVLQSAIISNSSLKSEALLLSHSIFAMMSLDICIEFKFEFFVTGSCICPPVSNSSSSCQSGTTAALKSAALWLSPTPLSPLHTKETTAETSYHLIAMELVFRKLTKNIQDHI